MSVFSLSENPNPPNPTHSKTKQNEKPKKKYQKQKQNKTKGCSQSGFNNYRFTFIDSYTLYDGDKCTTFDCIDELVMYF